MLPFPVICSSRGRAPRARKSSTGCSESGHKLANLSFGSKHFLTTQLKVFLSPTNLLGQWPVGHLLYVVRGCSHIQSKSTTLSVSIHIFCTHKIPVLNNYPTCQQLSAFGLPPLPPSSAFVSICLTPLLYYYFLRRLVYMIKWRIFIC